jgi:hypothetical protein
VIFTDIITGDTNVAVLDNKGETFWASVRLYQGKTVDVEIAFMIAVNDDTKITITKYIGDAKNVVILESIDQKNVTSIGDEAFYDDQLTSVNIPNRITSIGYMAFADNQLTSINIPNKVTSIGDRAFASNQLISVDIPISVTFIGSGAFRLNSIVSVNIGNNVQIEEGESFQNGFTVFYSQNEKKAGRYTYDGSGWTYGN